MRQEPHRSHAVPESTYREPLDDLVILDEFAVSNAHEVAASTVWERKEILAQAEELDESERRSETAGRPR
jgi:hypothetical protein